MSLAADSRRARYSLLRTADLSGSRSPYQEPFPISPFTFVPDDGGKYIAPARKTARFGEREKTVIHHPAQLLARHPFDR